MFSRKRAHSNPPQRPKTPTTPTAAASTAAAQAFLANRVSNANLSNAAAAAALRSHTSSPIPVSEIQTKRMVRRGSASSAGSARPEGLQRRDSGGSMTERTFRDPSPSRNTAPAYYDTDAPPVPALPKGYASPPPVPVKSIQRPVSVEPPERVLSPPPRLGGRGVSLDRGPATMPSRLREKAQTPGAKLKSAREVDNSRVRDSINFSRPMSPANSPPTSPFNQKRVTSPTPAQVPNPQRTTNAANVGRLRDGEAENIEYSVQKAAAPVKNKKKIVPKQKAQGSHLVAGTSAGRATGTAVQRDAQKQPQSGDSTTSPSNTRVPEPQAGVVPKPLPKKKKKKKLVAVGPIQEDAAAPTYVSDSESVASERSSTSDRSRTYNTRAAGVLAKQPSIVREDKEAEEQEGDLDTTRRTETEPLANGSATAETAKTKQNTANGKPKSQKTSTFAHAKKDSLDIPSDVSSSNVEAATSIATPVKRLSLSPGRAAHFSAQPIFESPDGVKHQPPARSVSPAKSALKHSPSRGASPNVGILGNSTQRRGPASEASDTTSIVSDEGTKGAPKRKKSVRVSFDSDSVAVGRAATPPTDPDSPVIMSPQNKGVSGKKKLGFGREKAQRTSGTSKDHDFAIQPTPVLPSFGSVRGRSEQEPPTNKTETQQTQTTSQPSTLGSPSDQNVGSILARVFHGDESTIAAKSTTPLASDEPLPPEVTSVEGTGYHSDTNSSIDNDYGEDQQLKASLPATAAAPTKTAETEETMRSVKSLTGPSAESPQTAENTMDVPSIAVQPASPRPEDVSPTETQQVSHPFQEAPTVTVQPATPLPEELSEARDDYWVHLPGGFPVSTEASDTEQPSALSVTGHKPADYTPASTGITEPKHELQAATAETAVGPPVTGVVAEALPLQTDVNSGDESDDTNNSIYSDAAEDISDLEGDGFGSINAIVESPASVQKPVSTSKTPESPTKAGGNKDRVPRSPLARNDSELSEPGPEEGWDKAQAYWSGLSQSRKEQIERAAAHVPAEPSAIQPQTKPKKKKSVPKKPAGRTSQVADASQAPLPPSLEKQDGKPERKSTSTKAPAMKKSMRTSPTESTQELEKGQPAPMRKSMRSSQPPDTVAGSRMAMREKQRPISAVGASEYDKAHPKSLINGHDRAVSLGGATRAATSVSVPPAKKKNLKAKPLGRTKSNDSDSSSSFKKARPTASESGKYTMRRSMRGNSVDERPQSMHGRSTSLTARTSSPAGSTQRRPLSSVGPGMSGSMRTSLRGSIDSGKRAKSPSRFPGFGKSKAKPATPSGPKSRFSSRFADSSDEDDAPVNRRSRFADSSDEDEPVNFTPVRGIPRRIDEGDSTDLEDSSDEKAVAKPTTAQPKNEKLEGRALGAGSLRTVPEETAAGPSSTLGIGLQGKRNEEKEKKKRSFFGGLGSKKAPKSEPVTIPATPAVPKQDIISNQTGKPTASTPATQSQANPPLRLTTDLSASPQAKKSPKLQRRISAQQAEKIQMKRGMSDSWPLPQSPGGASTPTMRPTTSDGTPKQRVGLGMSGLSREVKAQDDDARTGLGKNDPLSVAGLGGGLSGEKPKKKGWFKKAFGR
ncbi:MAG: hypothetical protein Q9191_005710 [Dirinaria sp. TL-2023a]